MRKLSWGALALLVTSGCFFGNGNKGSSSSAAASTTGQHGSTSTSSASTSGTGTGSTGQTATGSASTGTAGTSGSASTSTGSTGSTSSSGTTGGTLPLCEACTSNAQCQSGYCDRVTHVCNTSDLCSANPSLCTNAGLTCDGATNNCVCPGVTTSSTGSTGSTSSTSTTGTSTGSTGTSSSGSTSSTTGGTGALCDACASNADCVSGYCDRGTHVCNTSTPCTVDPSACANLALACDTFSGNCTCLIQDTSSSSSGSTGSTGASSTGGTSTGSTGTSGSSGGTTGGTLAYCDTCAVNGDCASGYCDRVLHVCGPATPCTDDPTACPAQGLTCDAATGDCLCPGATTGSSSSSGSSSAGSTGGTGSTGTTGGSTGGTTTGGTVALCGTCASNADCVSGYCDRGTHVCNSATPCTTDATACTNAGLACDSFSGNCACPGVTTGTSGSSGSGATSGSSSGSSGSSSSGSSSSGSSGSSGSGSSSGSSGSIAPRLFIVSGDGQSAYQDQALSSLVVVEYDNDGGPVANATLTVTPPVGAGALPKTITTDSAGHANLNLRLSRDVGSQAFTVAGPNGTSAVTTASAVGVDAGVIITLVNTDHNAGDDGAPGPATLAHTGYLYDMALASDGSIYFVDYSACRIKKLGTSGQLTLIAGNGTCGGSQNNGGPALNASLYYPQGIALDEAGNRLFVADTSNNLIRVVDLTTGTIDIYAGGNNSASSPGYGDGSIATAAMIAQPTRLSLHQEGSVTWLYLVDQGHNRFRRISLTTQIIEAWFTPGYVSGAPFSVTSINNNAGSNLVFDSQGGAIFSGQMYSTNYFYGVARRAADGTLSLLAGAYSGSTTDGVPATQAGFQAPPYVAVDPAGNIYLADSSDQRIRRVDGSSGRIHTVSGSGTAAFSGDYGPWSAAQYNKPFAMLFDGAGNLFITDQQNRTLREVAQVGATTPLAVNLSVVLGDGTVAELDQNAPQLFTVKLTDESGLALANYNITWTAVDPGSAMYVSSSKTNAAGKATALGRVGLAPGAYHFKAAFADAYGNNVPGSPVTFTVTATPPAAGTLFTIANVNHANGDTGFGGAATFANLKELRDTVRASDGTIYVAAYGEHRVLKVSPQGVITSLAGNGSYGYTGDGFAAANAQLNGPSGLALDEANQVLYVADTGNYVIRYIDLSTNPPTINAFAGNGSPSGPLGDNGPIQAASFYNPTHLYLRTEGSTPFMYVADTGHNAIRKINLFTSIVTSFLNTSTIPSGKGGPFMYDCGGSDGCSVVWPSDGKPLVSMHLYGGSGYYPQGIVRYDPTNNPDGGYPNGTISVVLGQNGSGSSTDGSPASNFALGAAPNLTLDPSGTLVFADPQGNEIRYIDSGNLVQRLIGSGTAGYAGDSVPYTSTSVQLKAPWQIQWTPEGHILITDGQNYCLREAY